MENVPGIIDHAPEALAEFHRTLADLGYTTSTIEMTAAAAAEPPTSGTAGSCSPPTPDNAAVVTPKPLLDQASVPAATLRTLVASDGRSSGLGPCRRWLHLLVQKLCQNRSTEAAGTPV